MTFFFIIALLLIITIVIDLTDKIDNMLEYKVSLFESVRYYLNYIPYIISLLAPLFVFISVIFFTSRLTERSEVIAMISGGVNFYRLLLPFMGAAFFIAALLFVNNHFIAPIGNKYLLDFKYKYLDPDEYLTQVNSINLQTPNGELIYVSNFNFNNNTGYKFQLDRFEGKKVDYRLRARSLFYVDSTDQWKVRDYLERKIEDENETLNKGNLMDIDIGLIPEDFRMLVTDREKLTTPELNRQLQREKQKGSKIVQFYQVEKHKRTAIPVSVLILTLIGVSISSKKRRGGIGMNLAFGMLISAVFVLSMNFTETIAENTGASSSLSVWVPNMIFGILALILMLRAQK